MYGVMRYQVVTIVTSESSNTLGNWVTIEGGNIDITMVKILLPLKQLLLGYNYYLARQPQQLILSTHS